jgi:Tol biopolymer transport system component
MAQSVVDVGYAPETFGSDPAPEALGAGQAFGHPVSISADGRYAVLLSSHGLDPDDTDGASDIYLLDRNTGTYTWITEGGSGGSKGNSFPVISEDGRFVAFSSLSSFPGTGDVQGIDAFIYDVQAGTLEVASRHGLVGTTSIANLSITPDGRYVVYDTSNNADDGDGNSLRDVYVYDRVTNALDWISSSAGSGVSAGDSTRPQITPDGRFVVYQSAGSVAGDTNPGLDVYVYDRQEQTTQVLSNGVERFGGVTTHAGRDPLISDDGRYVAFVGDSSTAIDIYLHDRGADLASAEDDAPLLKITQSSGGSDVRSAELLAMSPDGEHIVFSSMTNGLVPGDFDNAANLFVYSRTAKTIESIAAVENDRDMRVRITDDGRFVAFETPVSQTPDDTNGAVDVYVHDRDANTTVLVSPADAGSASHLGTITPDGSFVTFQSSANPEGVFGGYLASFEERVKQEAMEQGRLLSFDLTVNGTAQVLVDWGDGRSETVPVAPGQQTIRLSHVFPDNPGLTFEGTVTLKGGAGEPDLTYALNVGLSGFDAGQAPITGDSPDGGVTDNQIVFVTRVDSPLVFHGGLALGDEGDDLVFGYIEEDELAGYGGDDQLFGRQGNDALHGDFSTVTDAGDYVLTFERTGHDTLWGDAGDDLMIGGPGNDILRGGADQDRAVYSGTRGDYTIEVLGDGALRITDDRGFDGSDIVYDTEIFDFAAEGGGRASFTRAQLEATIAVPGEPTPPTPPVTPTIPTIPTIPTVPTATTGPTPTASPTDPAATGTTGNDSLGGTAGDDELGGGPGSDALTGGAGHDRLAGGPGSDTLTGGTGPGSMDSFVFDAALKRNVDTITDFERSYDQILLDDAFFKGLGKGTPDGTPLKKSMFAANAEGEATSDGTAQIVYETDTGRLLYDRDGEGGKKAVQFALLEGAPKLTFKDFEII